MTLSWDQFQLKRERIDKVHDDLAAALHDLHQAPWAESELERRAGLLRQATSQEAVAILNRFGEAAARLTPPDPTSWTAEQWAARSYHREQWTRRLDGTAYADAVRMLADLAIEGDPAEKFEGWAAFEAAGIHDPDAGGKEVARRAERGPRQSDPSDPAELSPAQQLRARLLPPADHDLPHYRAAREAAIAYHATLAQVLPSITNGTTTTARGRVPLDAAIDLGLHQHTFEQAASVVAAAEPLRATTAPEAATSRATAMAQRSA